MGEERGEKRHNEGDIEVGRQWMMYWGEGKWVGKVGESRGQRLVVSTGEKRLREVIAEDKWAISLLPQSPPKKTIISLSFVWHKGMEILTLQSQQSSETCQT